jgi:hypothetical protein
LLSLFHLSKIISPFTPSFPEVPLLPHPPYPLYLVSLTFVFLLPVSLLFFPAPLFSLSLVPCFLCFSHTLLFLFYLLC